MAAAPALVHRIARSGVLPLCRRLPAWGRAVRQLPGLPLAPCRAFSNNKVQVEMNESSGVATMKFKSPPVNSLSLDFLTEFCISLEKLENDRACRGIIITSAIPKIFSSGLDITEMCGKSTEHYTEFWRAVQEIWLRLYSSNMVTLAVINGSSPAGGCLIALSCDYRIMAENPKYTIGLNEAQLGIVAPFWFKDTFVNVVGQRVAERSLQLGSLYPAPEALKFGIVDELMPEEKLQEKAAAVMAQWLALPGGTMQILSQSPKSEQESALVKVSVAHRSWSNLGFPVHGGVGHFFTIVKIVGAQGLDHARQITKAMMRKTVLDRLIAHREEDIKNFISFVSKESIQKSLRMYMEKLKKKS